MTRPILDARTNVQMAGEWHTNFVDSKNEDNPTKNENNLTQNKWPHPKNEADPTQKIEKISPKIKTNPPKKIDWSHLWSEDALPQ